MSTLPQFRALLDIARKHNLGSVTIDSEDFAQLLAVAEAAMHAPALIWPDDPSAHFDESARAFYAKTGLLPPGKDSPCAFDAADTLRASLAWREWLQNRAKEVAGRLRDALKPLCEGGAT